MIDLTGAIREMVDERVAYHVASTIDSIRTELKELLIDELYYLEKRIERIDEELPGIDAAVLVAGCLRSVADEVVAKAKKVTPNAERSLVERPKMQTVRERIKPVDASKMTPVEFRKAYILDAVRRYKKRAGRAIGLSDLSGRNRKLEFSRLYCSHDFDKITEMAIDELVAEGLVTRYLGQRGNAMVGLVD